MRVHGHDSMKSQGNLLLAGIALAAVATGGMFLFLNDPARCAWYPPCLWHRLTGLYCPGCGSTRALYCLAHGDLAGACQKNLLLVLALPVVGLWLAAAWRWRPSWRSAQVPAWLLAVLAAAVVLFGILRNLPLAPFCFLAPH